MAGKLRVLLTGGGSGGHVYPLLAVAEALKKKAAEENFEPELFYYGSIDAWSAALLRAGVNTQSIMTGKLRRYFSLANFLDVPKFFLSLIQVFFKMFFLMPDVIFSKGGTGAYPVVLAGWFYRIPIVIHDSDAIPGLTNLLSARFARRIAVSFDRALKYFDPRKTALTGNPVRKDFTESSYPQETAKKELGFDSDKPLLLILGGSQGCRRINEFIEICLKDIIKETQVLHQAGMGNFKDIQKLSRAALIDVPAKEVVKFRYNVVPYLDSDDMKAAYTAADLVVARAGSGTIFELAAFGKPAILIPLLESAKDHQRANAYEFAKTGAAVVIEETNLLPGVFINQLKTILKNPVLLGNMKSASAKFFKADAAEVIAREIMNLA